MTEFIFSGISVQCYAIFYRKNDLQINSKTGFQKRKPDFGFKTENQISGFRLTSLNQSRHGLRRFLFKKMRSLAYLIFIQKYLQLFPVDHISQYMRDVLHWLPFPQRISYRIAFLVWLGALLSA